MSAARTFAENLISAPSVTPARGLVFDVMEEMLSPLGFDVHRFIAGDGDEGSEDAPVENLYAIRPGPDGARHFAFAGHLDVVPPGEGWTAAPFAPEVRGDLLYGRGAVDMKGAIAAMVAAMADIPKDAGTISFIITGDQEGPALHGTRALIDYMEAEGIRPDLCLVGEPTSVDRLGDMLKIGRRASLNIWLEVDGTQGHVAYPALVDNPIHRALPALAELAADADLLICECAAPDDAPIEGHLTPSDVAAIADAARPQELWLTHLYPGVDAPRAVATVARTGIAVRRAADLDTWDP